MNEPQRKRPRAARKAAVLAGTGAADGLLLPDILRGMEMVEYDETHHGIKQFQ